MRRSPEVEASGWTPGGGGRQGVDDAVDLLVGRHQRGTERARVGADGPGDHAAVEHRVADRHGVLIGPEARRPHRPGAPYVIDNAVGGE